MRWTSLRVVLASSLILGTARGAAPAAASAPDVPIDTLPRIASAHLNFVTLVVADMASAVRFYTTVLHMHERGRAQPNARYFEVVMGYDDTATGAGISLTYRNGPPHPKGNGSSSINLVVTDLVRILEQVVPLGGKIIATIQRVDAPTLSYSFARIQDPDDNFLELVQYHRIGTVSR